MPQVTHGTRRGVWLFLCIPATSWAVGGSVCSLLLFPAPRTEGKRCLSGIAQPRLGELLSTAVTPAFPRLPCASLAAFPALCACFHGFVRTGYAVSSELPGICVAGRANALQQNAGGRKGERS